MLLSYSCPCCCRLKSPCECPFVRVACAVRPTISLLFRGGREKKSGAPNPPPPPGPVCIPSHHFLVLAARPHLAVEIPLRPHVRSHDHFLLYTLFSPIFSPPFFCAVLDDPFPIPEEIQETAFSHASGSACVRRVCLYGERGGTRVCAGSNFPPSSSRGPCGLHFAHLSLRPSEASKLFVEYSRTAQHVGHSGKGESACAMALGPRRSLHHRFPACPANSRTRRSCSRRGPLADSFDS